MLICVWIFATPWTVACQAPLPMKFSRQELEWVAISYPRESSWPRDRIHVSYISCIGRCFLYHCIMKVHEWKLLSSVWLFTLCDLKDCILSGSSAHRILQARILEWVPVPFTRGSTQPRIKPRSLTLQADFLWPAPPGKPQKCIWRDKRPRLSNTIWNEKNKVGIVTVNQL